MDKRKKLEQLFLKKPKFIHSLISDNYAFTADEIERYKDKLEWTNIGLSSNPNLPWSMDLIKKYETRWRWENLLVNRSIKLDFAFLDYCKGKNIIKKIDATRINWDEEIFENFKDDIRPPASFLRRNPMYFIKFKEYFQSSDFSQFFRPYYNEFIFKENEYVAIAELSEYEMGELISKATSYNKANLSMSKHLPWSENLIEKFTKSWDWEELSRNKYLPWSIYLIQKYENKWNWELLSSNPSLPLCMLLLEKYADRWSFNSLSLNEGIFWTVEMLEKYSEKLNWQILGRAPNLPWSLDLIRKFKNKWHFDAVNFSFSGNIYLPWSTELIEEFAEKWNWKHLSSNKSIPWNLFLLKKFEKKLKWGFSYLSSSEGINWTTKIIDTFIDKWYWADGGLSYNPNLPFSFELIEKYYDRWHWGTLAVNRAIWPNLFRDYIDENFVELLMSKINKLVYNEFGNIIDIKLIDE